MSDYTQVTAFTPKDSLVSGNPAKVIKGSEFDAEFAAISASLQTKADKSGAAFTGNISTTGNLNVSGNFQVDGTVTGIDKTDVGLSNVDNTSDANKPVSTATQTALDLKLNAANPSYTGTLTGGTGVVNLGSGQFVKDASGNVGVGTASPTQKLDVSGNARVPLGSSFHTHTVDYGVGTPDSAGLQLFAATGDFIRFGHRTSGVFTERARIDSSGNLLVGTTSAFFGEKVIFSNSSASTYNLTAISTSAAYTGGGVISGSSATASGSGFKCFTGYSSAGIVFDVLGNGNARNVNNSYGAISDLKLKENIVDVSPKLAKLLQVRIVNYTLKADPTKAKLIGVIAQELEQISPGLIEETPDYEEVKKTREVEVPAVEAVLDDEGNEVTPAVKPTTRTEEYTERVPLGTVTKSVKYSVFVPMLIKGVQEQQAQIEALQAQVNTQNMAMQLLVTRLEALEAK